MQFVALMQYAAAWVQLTLPFPFRLKALKLARPTTRAARAARAARSAIRRAAVSVRRMLPSPKPKAIPKAKGTLPDALQRPLMFDGLLFGQAERRAD